MLIYVTHYLLCPDEAPDFSLLLIIGKGKNVY
jgi:hypothetical protein